jgi:hypothetical protein
MSPAARTPRGAFVAGGRWLWGEVQGNRAVLCYQFKCRRCSRMYWSMSSIALDNLERGHIVIWVLVQFIKSSNAHSLPGNNGQFKSSRRAKKGNQGRPRFDGRRTPLC